MRTAVTTTTESYPRWELPLREQGLVPVGLPCIEIRPAAGSTLEAARRLAGSADLVVITSARAVRILWPEGGMPDVPAAVVGEATGRAVEEAGGAIGLVGDGGGDELVDRLVASVAGNRIFFPCGRRADRSRAERLQGAGATVETAVVYTTVPVPPADEEVEAVVFASPSAVEGWCLSRSLDVARVAALGPATAAALGERGRRPDLMPARPSVEALAAALALGLDEGAVGAPAGGNR